MVDAPYDGGLFSHLGREGLKTELHLNYYRLLTNMQLSGLLVAFLGISTVYFLPRAVPGFRAVIGMPGV